MITAFSWRWRLCTRSHRPCSLATWYWTTSSSLRRALVTLRDDISSPTRLLAGRSLQWRVPVCSFPTMSWRFHDWQAVAADEVDVTSMNYNRSRVFFASEHVIYIKHTFTDIDHIHNLSSLPLFTFPDQCRVHGTIHNTYHTEPWTLHCHPSCRNNIWVFFQVLFGLPVLNISLTLVFLAANL